VEARDTEKRHRRILQRLPVVAAWLTVGLGVLLYLGFGLDTVAVMPGNAFVYLDDTAKLYFAPGFEPREGVRLARASEAHELGYLPDKKSRDAGAFMEEGPSLSGFLLRRIGILKPRRSRWNDDGTWNEWQ